MAALRGIDNNMHNLQHGYRADGQRSPEYVAWVNMKDRCNNKNHDAYTRYGGQGIVVCDEWADNFPAFLAHVGKRPSPEHSIDRHPNNDGNYEPDNVRWATAEQQANNRRSNRVIEFNGRKMTLSEWDREMGFPRNFIFGRLQAGWPIDRAITEPRRFRSKRSV